MIYARLRRLFRDRRGNVAMMFAITALPLVLLGGMAVDYTMASDKQTQLNGYADAAALSAVTPAMMSQNNAASQTAATNTFNSQAETLGGITYLPSNLGVNVVTNNDGTRTASVTYSAAYPTFFSTLLGVNQINLGGTSVATGGLPPNINFYLMLDDSPSMALAATTAGVQTLINNTQGQVDPQTGSKGCAFACHEYQPSQENPPLRNPGGEDNYTLAQNLGLTLRIDLVKDAVKDLTNTATTKMSNTNAAYKMALFTFDVTLNRIQALTPSMPTVSNSADNIQLLEVCYNNRLSCSGPSASGDDDMDSDFDQAMYKINNRMPDPGSGTNAAGDTPQEVLFIVTDGAEDACEQPDTVNPTSYTPCRQQYYMSYINGPGNKYDAPAGQDWCTTVKNRGIRIAVLYTTYVPMLSPPLTNYTSSWYLNFMGSALPKSITLPSGGGMQSFVNATNDQIATNLQNCASPGLFTEVQNDGDISAALGNLFDAAVSTAYLMK